MQPTKVDEDTVIVDVPVSPLLKAENRYGSVPGLDDEDLADPAELERQVYREQFGPIWLLPVQSGASGIRPNVGEDGRIEWGAFGTVDFDRIRPAFDKARYKLDKMQEELKDLIIRFKVTNGSVQVRQKYRVLKMVRNCRLDVDDISHPGLWLLARLYQRVVRLHREIGRIEKARLDREKRQAARFWARFD